MKTALRNVFSPILNIFESGEGEISYKKSHRTVLIIVGGLFLLLSFISVVAAVATSQLGAAIPFLIFFAAGFVCVVVGSCGSNRAVAKIWGNK